MIIFDVYTKISDIILFTLKDFIYWENILCKNFWKITLKKATWTFAKLSPPPCEQMWTFRKLPPPPHPVHVVCEWPLWAGKIIILDLESSLFNEPFVEADRFIWKTIVLCMKYTKVILIWEPALHRHGFLSCFPPTFEIQILQERGS